ncbi:MAG: hypothetical protein WBQ09_14015 [Terriglobales bacterium]|jgi:hypothetical protein
MTHEHLLELVSQVNGALALVSWSFIVYEALGKSAPVRDLKDKLDLRRDEIFSTIILDIEEAMRPFWPTPRARRQVSEDGTEKIVWDWPTVLSDDARDAVRNCIAKNEGISVRAAEIRGLAGRVSAWDKVTFRCVLCAALMALLGLASWFFYEGMPDHIATAAIIIPLFPAILALAAAATRQTYWHRANDAIIQDDQ